MIFDRWNERVAALRNPSIVGLDTHYGLLPAELQARLEPADKMASAADLILTFNKGILDALVDVVPCVKVQIAFYEQYGWQGYKAYVDTLQYAKRLGYITIADAKRNDIGSTAEAYATAFLGETDFGDKTIPAMEADLLTVNGYLGADGIEPFRKECVNRGKGIFVLVKTSNPGSGELQDKPMADDSTVYETMADMVDNWGKGTQGKSGYQAIGAVVGATYPQQGRDLRMRVPHIPFLVPGYGAQGAKATDVAQMFDENGFGAYVNASRSIITAYQKSEKPYGEAALDAAIAMREDLLSALSQAGRLGY
ncbi:orotidine-5'-phosphate decarboxylase [Eubacteriales bacterium OttesenSCG-928-M02]|nr:orotidine-5'-phosphate decarboxylase [Eubacteriales bacterium OttesenSCG-928-M02]